MRLASHAAAFVLMLVSAGKSFAADQGIALTGTAGIDYSSGNYGSIENTNVLVALTTLGAEVGNFHFNLSAPYLQISGQGLIVFDAAGNPIAIDQGTSSKTRSGFGDISISAAYAIPPAVLDDFAVQFTGRLKIPTGSSAKGLSTGKVDFGMSLDVSREFGIWGPFVTLGYLVAGQPSDYSLNNTYSISTGTSIELNDHLIAILSYDYDSPSTPLVNASQELFGSLSWVFDDTTTLTGYATTGLSDGGPNIGGGLLVSYKLR